MRGEGGGGPDGRLHGRLEPLNKVTRMRSNLGMGLVLMASTVMVAQAPLIKPGLWEMTTVRNSGDGSPLKGKARICVAAADREKIVRPDMPNIPGCTLNVAK